VLFFESVHKTAHVLCATAERYLFDTKKCVLEHVFGMMHTQLVQVLRRDTPISALKIWRSLAEERLTPFDKPVIDNW